MLAVSLTTIPPRFATLGATLESLRAQRRAPDLIRVTIPRRYRRFPDWDGTPPALPAGVELRVVEEDLGPATKLLPLAAELAGTGARILYCDDDWVYGPAWTARICATARARPGMAIAGAGFDVDYLGLSPLRPRPGPRPWLRPPAQMIRTGRPARSAGPAAARAPRTAPGRHGHVDIAQGFAGVLVNPDWFAPETAKIPAALWAIDDIWLSGWLAQRGVGIWCAPHVRAGCAPHAGEAGALQDAVLDGQARGAANKAGAALLARRWGIWGGAAAP